MARHWVAAHLRDLPAEVTGCAALLTSELVTNAVLHAATPMCVTLHILPDRIRVDVADGNPAFPSIKEYGKDAATGRGLTLFNTLASNWGVQAVDGGKIVWFELPVDFPVDPDERLGRQLPLRPRPASTQPGLHGDRDDSPEVSVRLLGIPVGLLQKSSEEYEALFRELRLMKERAGSSPDAPPLPERLSVLVSQIGTRFNGLGPGHGRHVADGGRQQGRVLRLDARAAAIRRGGRASSTTPCSTRPTSSDWPQRLLTLPASPTSVAVRRWFLSELTGNSTARRRWPGSTAASTPSCRRVPAR